MTVVLFLAALTISLVVGWRLLGRSINRAFEQMEAADDV